MKLIQYFKREEGCSGYILGDIIGIYENVKGKKATIKNNKNISFFNYLLFAIVWD